jgi:hypothetical protein
VRPAALLAMALAWVLLVAGPAAAQTDVNGVEVSVERTWPEYLEKGYFPLFVLLENRNGEARAVSLLVKNDFAFGGDVALRELTQRVELAPKEVRRLELLVPVFGVAGTSMPFGQQFGVTVTVGGKSTGLDAGGEPWNAGDSPVVVFAPQPLNGTDLAKLDASIEDLILTAPLDGHANLLGAGFDVRLTAPGFESLPREWAAYSSLSLVGLDLTREMPIAARVEPLLRWVRLGGSLVLVGDAEALTRQLDSLEGAFEPRFLLGSEEGVRLYRHGLGRIYRTDAADGTDHRDARLALQDALAASSSADRPAHPTLPSTAGWRLSGTRLEIPGVGQLPLQTFMVLLLLFAIVIGPVNMMVLKRLKRPALLLVTIPSISAAASLGLLLYGVFYQGIDTKAARQSLTFLDQRTSRAAVVERRRLFVGLSQSGGLVPGAGTAVFPEDVGGEGRFIVQEEDGRSLRGSYLPVRDQVNQMVLTESAGRTHLDVRREGTGLRVTNAFDGKLEGVLVRDPAGAWFWSGEPLEAGQSARLEPYTPEPDGNPIERRLGGRKPMYRFLELVPGSYMAGLDEGPFTDDCGLELSVRSDEHRVLGILSMDEEDWR